MKVLEYLKGIVLIPIVMLGGLLALISQMLEKKVDRTTEEVKEIIYEMASGNPSDDYWYEFLNQPIKNRKLEKIRERAAILWEYEDFQLQHKNGHYVLNVKGLSEMQGIIGDLQSIKNT
jgi:hypothetical protein